MTVFDQDYASAYDLLYRDKDYAGETDFALAGLRRHARAPLERLLDLGCGTGRHDLLFAERGLGVHGVDRSPDMIAQARARSAAGAHPPPTFDCAEVQNLRLDRCFDCATALFHVVSYLTGEQDLADSFRALRAHLEPGTPFLFDFWYGPAILRDGVQRREREAENADWHVHRRTEPVWEPSRDIVRINFHITGTRKADGHVRQWHEEHVMRYFDEARLTALLADAGLRGVESGRWMRAEPPTADDLNAYMVAVAI